MKPKQQHFIKIHANETTLFIDMNKKSMFPNTVPLNSVFPKEMGSDSRSVHDLLL